MSSDDRTVVLYFDNTFTFGGAINALAHLLSALDRDRYIPIVLSAQEQTLLDRHFPDLAAHHWPVKLRWVHQKAVGRKTRRAGLAGRALRWLWGKGRTLWWLVSVEVPATVRVARFARRHDVGIIHLNNGVEGMLPALLAGKLLGVPVLAHSRGPQRARGTARYYARLPDQWVAVSGTMADNLERASVPRSRIAVVHDAIKLADFAPGPPPSHLGPEIGIPSGAPVFGIFGRIIGWKGIKEFVRAAARVLEELPRARALVVGDPSDGSERYYDEVKCLADDLDVGDRVIFTGFRSDVADLMRLCDVVVHTSIVPEPFGMTVIEAMATGTPVVAANSGGPVEIVEPDRTGFLVDPRDAVALSDAILELLRDPERAAAMGRRGVGQARSHYSADRYAHDLELLYERLTSSE